MYFWPLGTSQASTESLRLIMETPSDSTTALQVKGKKIKLFLICFDVNRLLNEKKQAVFTLS